MRIAEREGLSVVCDSAGTSDWNLGNAPYPLAVTAALARGYDLTPLRARQFSSRDFADFDLIVCMDGANVAAVEDMRPMGSMTPVHLLLDYVGPRGQAVPDPFHTRGLDEALDLIEAGCSALVSQLLQNASAVSPNAR